MKTFLIFSGLALSTLTSFSQKCSYDKDETDKFSGLIKRSIEQTMINNVGQFAITDDRFMKRNAFWLTIIREGSNYALEAICTRYNRKLEAIKNTDTMMVRVENGKIIKLSPQPYAPKFDTKGNTIYKLKYLLTQDEAMVLAESPTDVIRIKLDEIVDVETRGQRGEKFMKAVACILK